MTDLNIGKQGEKLYVPSVVAVESLEFRLENPMELNCPPGVLFANGEKPASSNGGVVSLGGRLWGVDHVAVESKSNEIIFKSTDKSAIEVEKPERNVGRVREEGVIILTDLETENIVFGALMKIDRGWTREAFVRSKLNVYQVGHFIVGIPNMFSKLPDALQIVKKNDTELITKPRG
ncbi:MAG: hypothetical protein U0451_00485 [Candidatus Saccharimonadales bacterium]